MNNFVNNLRIIRECLEISTHAIAKRKGRANSTILGIEKRRLTKDEAKEFAEIINAEIGQNICTNEDMRNPNFSKTEFLSRIQTPNIIFQPQNPNRIKEQDLAKYGEYFADEESDTLSIPFIQAKACCGNGIMDFDHAIKFKLALSLVENILNTKVLLEDVKSNRYFFISAEGDSMQPFIESGDALMIDTNIKTIPQHRQILLIEDAGNRKMLREFCYLTGNKYRVRAYNDDYKSYDEVSYEYVVNEIFGGSFTILGGLVPISIGKFKYPDIKALSRNVIVPK